MKTFYSPVSRTRNPVRQPSRWSMVAGLALAVGLVGCGDNGGSSLPAVASPPAAAIQPAWNLSGIGFKGPIASAKVCVVARPNVSLPNFDVTCTTADALGNYSLSVTPEQIAATVGPYFMQVTGGTYVDEATGQIVPLATPLTAYLGETVASVNGTLDRQALLAASTSVNNSLAGNGGDGVIVDDGDGGPFIGEIRPTTSSAALSTKTFVTGTFNLTIASTLQINLAQGLPGGLKDANAKNAQTTVNTALGLNINTVLVQSTPKNGASTFDAALQNLALLASDKGLSTVLDSSPASIDFLNSLGQVQSTASNLPSRWIFTSPAVPNGQRLTLLPTGEINLPNLGALKLRIDTAGAVQALPPTGVTAVYRWLGGRVLTLCGPGNTLVGSLFAPNTDGLIPGDAGFVKSAFSLSTTLGCNTTVDFSTMELGTQVPAINWAAAANGFAKIQPSFGALIVSGVTKAPGALVNTTSDLAMVLASAIPTASLPAGNYVQWAGGPFNATNSYELNFESPMAVNFMPTPTASGGSGTASISVNNADGRVFVRGTAPSGNPFVSGFIEPRGFGAMLCERNAQGRLQAVAALTAGLSNASIQISGSQLFGRQWQFVQGCALGANALGTILQTTIAAQGWTNSYAGNLSQAQMDTLLLPSSTGVPAQTPLGSAGDRVFYSAFRVGGVGSNGLVMLERSIISSGQTRDLRLFYTVD